MGVEVAVPDGVGVAVLEGVRVSVDVDTVVAVLDGVGVVVDKDIEVAVLDGVGVVVVWDIEVVVPDGVGVTVVGYIEVAAVRVRVVMTVEVAGVPAKASSVFLHLRSVVGGEIILFNCLSSKDFTVRINDFPPSTLNNIGSFS